MMRDQVDGSLFFFTQNVIVRLMPNRKSEASGTLIAPVLPSNVRAPPTRPAPHEPPPLTVPVWPLFELSVAWVLLPLSSKRHQATRSDGGGDPDPPPPPPPLQVNSFFTRSLPNPS